MAVPTSTTTTQGLVTSHYLSSRASAKQTRLSLSVTCSHRRKRTRRPYRCSVRHEVLHAAWPSTLISSNQMPLFPTNASTASSAESDSPLPQAPPISKRDALARLIPFLKPKAKASGSAAPQGQAGDEAARDAPLVGNVGFLTLYQADNPTVDIVAIHGLNGHRERTWTASDGTMWLRDLLPAVLLNARILTYGYDARTHGPDALSTLSLWDHGTSFLSDLCVIRDATQSTRRPIIFVAHSLGGLVLKSALTHSVATRPGHLAHLRAAALSTHGILFFGTPHQGSTDVPHARLLLAVAALFTNTSAELLRDMESHSAFLGQQLAQFSGLADAFETKFFYESYPSTLAGGTQKVIVPRWSAVLPGQTNAEALAISADHAGMVQFVSATDDGFIKASTFLAGMASRAEATVLRNWRRWDVDNALASASGTTARVSVTLKDWRAQPDPPEDLKYVNLADPDKHGSDPTQYPVLMADNTEYWALSFIDNRFAFAILAYDANGQLIRRWDRDGARYLHKITIGHNAVTFTGQANHSVVFKFRDLGIGA